MFVQKQCGLVLLRHGQFTRERSITFELCRVSGHVFIYTYLFQLLLMSVLQCMYDSISQILRKNVEKRVVLDNLDVVMLALDEICDNG